MLTRREIAVVATISFLISTAFTPLIRTWGRTHTGKNSDGVIDQTVGPFVVAVVG